MKITIGPEGVPDDSKILEMMLEELYMRGAYEDMSYTFERIVSGTGDTYYTLTQGDTEIKLEFEAE